MFGFLVGTACLIGLVRVLRGPRWMRHRHWGCAADYGGYAGSCGVAGPCGRGYEPSYGGSRGRGFYDEDLYGPRFRRNPWGARARLFEDLELSRDQWKALREIRDEWKDAAQSARKSARVVKDDLASALRTETFDEGLVGASLAKFDEVSDGIKKATLTSLAKAHQVLDEKQRKKLADFIESRAFGRFGV